MVHSVTIHERGMIIRGVERWVGRAKCKVAVLLSPGNIPVDIIPLLGSSSSGA